MNKHEQTISRVIMIIPQCCNCIEKGKNAYCNNCIKSGDNYDVYRYAEDKNNRFSKGKMTGRIRIQTKISI
ncbi:MAG: hypothetical protein WA323_24255 [Candidatus Nitrosopolaris sp.]